MGHILLDRKKLYLEYQLLLTTSPAYRWGFGGKEGGGGGGKERPVSRSLNV